MEKERGRKAQPRIAPLRIVMLALACLLVAAAWGANRLATQGQPVGGARSRPAATVRATASRAAPTTAISAAVWRYDAVTRRNLFMPLASRQSQKLPVLPPVKPMPIDPFALREMDASEATTASSAPPPPRWIYAAFATVDGKPVAIVENSGTKEARFLGVGETLDGSVVSAVSPQTITLARGADVSEMKLSDAFTATPLNEPPKPTAQGGQGGRGQDGFAGGGRGEFLRRIMPVLRDNPELAANLMQMFGGRGQAGGEDAPQTVNRGQFQVGGGQR
jgi:hypothetical protein